MMRKSTRSILQELTEININKDVNLLVENRGANIIQSAVNLLELIKENYSQEFIDELERSFISSIRAGNTGRFTRCLKRLTKESKS